MRHKAESMVLPVRIQLIIERKTIKNIKEEKWKEQWKETEKMNV